MTRTTLSIQFVLILATVIGIRGQTTPRQAILTLKSDFEDGLANREFRVDYPGVDSNSAIIKIFQEGKQEAKVDYTVSKNARKPQLLYFELKNDEAPAGSYEVQVCLPGGTTCSEKRAALGTILEKEQKSSLSCKTFNNTVENEFERYLGNEKATGPIIKINQGRKFLTPEECRQVLTACSELELTSNPAYKIVDEKKVFYAAVWYDGQPLKELFERINVYCSRKYIFWASANVVDKKTKEVVRRFRGTIIVTKELADAFLLGSEPRDFPVEFARYDNEVLPNKEYYVSVSFCASDKDRINSSVCSEAIYSDLTFEASK